MIPRGALLQAMEALGFGPSDQQRIVDAVEAVLGESTEAIGGCVRACYGCEHPVYVHGPRGCERDDCGCTAGDLL